MKTKSSGLGFDVDNKVLGLGSQILGLSLEIKSLAKMLFMTANTTQN